MYVLGCKNALGPALEKMACKVKHFERKIVIISIPINLIICLGAQKNRLNETVLLSNHNIRFD